MPQSFFAYGSFAEKQVHHSKFAGLITDSKPGFVRGQAYRLRCGYPIVLPSDGGDWIEGVLYELNAPDSFWSIMDEMIGVDLTKPGLWTRDKVFVQCNHLSQTIATFYGLNAQKMRQVFRPIKAGRWHEDMSLAPPLTQQLDERHLDYIKKLSKAKGRELVPYKLDVYRALLSMELIKDKGRRPALTSLGQEISLFLQ